MKNLKWCSCFCTIFAGVLTSCSVDSMIAMSMDNAIGRAANRDAMKTAIAQNNVVQVKSLIAQGVDLNATDSKGNTPLMEASRLVGSEQIVSLFLNSGSNPNIRNKAGETALDIAQRSNNAKAASILKSAMGS